MFCFVLFLRKNAHLRKKQENERKKLDIISVVSVTLCVYVRSHVRRTHGNHVEGAGNRGHGRGASGRVTEET